jgi:hypothetical protein
MNYQRVAGELPTVSPKSKPATSAVHRAPTIRSAPLRNATTEPATFSSLISITAPRSAGGAPAQSARADHSGNPWSDRGKCSAIFSALDWRAARGRAMTIRLKSPSMSCASPRSRFFPQRLTGRVTVQSTEQRLAEDAGVVQNAAVARLDRCVPIGTRS